jgi:hypothetical protein
MGATVAAKNRKVRQDTLRELLSNKGLAQQVIEIATKLENQHLELEASHIQALRASADLKLRLVNKYLPDLKAMELSNDPDSPVGGMSDTELENRIKALENDLKSQD